ncbi:Transcriptional regulatory protein CitB [Polaromonas vacuolata]|uniref:Transcriptional regulatory protein CitB n=1 Tax=Polaromonas vacuolata TaxID=37448 RepID=A0A6H2H759_9BURK|nr:response regulator [Polaromonas vacuolata]QJC55434.1 Transcriptional regulatory protein CitB [Polaromonas vacuolata]
MPLITYVVEDNPVIRESLISTLEKITPVNVVGFADTESQANNWLSSHPGEWQLAIVDLFLKQGTGLGVLKSCQQRKKHQKVVVLSNYATGEVRRRCAELGSDAVFDSASELNLLYDYCASVNRANTKS